MPIFIWEIPGERDDFTHLSGGFYGFPAIDGPEGGIKLATERYEQPADPDEPLPAATGAREATRLHEEHIAPAVPVGRCDAAEDRVRACTRTPAAAAS